MGFRYSEWVQTQYRQLSPELYNTDLAVELQWNIGWSSISWQRLALLIVLKLIYFNTLIKVSQDTNSKRCHVSRIYNSDWQVFISLSPRWNCLLVLEISVTLPANRFSDLKSGGSGVKILCVCSSLFCASPTLHFQCLVQRARELRIQVSIITMHRLGQLLAIQPFQLKRW